MPKYMVNVHYNKLLWIFVDFVKSLCELNIGNKISTILIILQKQRFLHSEKYNIEYKNLKPN